VLIKFDDRRRDMIRLQEFKSFTIAELENIFDTIFDANDHPIFFDEHGCEIVYESYNEAFIAWVVYVLDNDAEVI
jgi:hypothetical protein